MRVYTIRTFSGTYLRYAIFMRDALTYAARGIIHSRHRRRDISLMSRFSTLINRASAIIYLTVGSLFHFTIAKRATNSGADGICSAGARTDAFLGKIFIFANYTTKINRENGSDGKYAR